MSNEILRALYDANSSVSEAIEILKTETGYSNNDKYISILEKTLNDLEVVSGAIEIEEKLIADPELQDKILFK